MNTVWSAENYNQEFASLSANVEKLKNTDTQKALALLKTAKAQFEHLSLLNQLKYYQLEADILNEQSRFQLAKDIASNGLTLSKKLKSPSILIAELSYTRGFAIESLGNLKLAENDYRNGLDVAQSLNDQLVVAKGLINLGAIYYQTNRYKLSLTLLTEALAIATRLDDEDLKGFINSELGNLYAYIGELDKSLAYYRKAYKHYNNIGKPSYAINALANMAMNYQSDGRYDDAIKLYKELLEKTKGEDYNTVNYNIYTGLSWCYLRKKDPSPETSYQYLLIAEQYLPSVEQYGTALNFLIDKSYVLEALQRYDDALEALYSAENLFTSQQKENNEFNYIAILGLKAKINRALGHYETAYQIISDYVERYIKYVNSVQMSAVQEMRLKYESEQSAAQQKRLKKANKSQSLELLKIEAENKNQQIVFLMIALIVLIITWFLYKLIKGKRRLLFISRTDTLTGLDNRRYLREQAFKLLQQAKQNNKPVSLLMIDIDHFKQVNDQYGHKSGDLVLQTLAQLGKNLLRDKDIFARFGGEEFVVILPNTTNEQAQKVAQRIRNLMAEQSWSFQSANKESITLSVGVATLTEQEKILPIAKSFEQLLKRADDLLYQAKEQGRDQVCA